jgi:protein-L-isoaspartate O-methyltransferase
VPPALEAQLAEGGRMVAVIRAAGRARQGDLDPAHRRGDRRASFRRPSGLLPGFAAEPGFVF